MKMVLVFGLSLMFLALASSQGHAYHTEGLTCMAISSDSTLALTGSKDGSVGFVNITSGRVSIFVAYNILMLHYILKKINSDVLFLCKLPSLTL